MRTEDRINQASLPVRLVHALTNHIVVVVILALTIGSYLVSGVTPSFLLQEIISRFSRNAFLVLSLIIPVIAGIGLNFGIVLGAMAGQIAIIAVVGWDISGFPSFLLAVLLSTPFAVLFGWLTGKVLNRTKGNEMITSMILGYLANGIYQFIFMCLIGPVIPFPKKEMMINTGVGIISTLDFTGTFKYSLDNLLSASAGQCFLALMALAIVWNLWGSIRQYRLGIRGKGLVRPLAQAAVCVAGAVLYFLLPAFRFVLDFCDVSVSTLVVIALLCLFNRWILKTKLGQDMRTVGQSQEVAAAAGINVDTTRIIAIIISTIFAAWGQIIHLQNIGTMNVYSHHEQVGLLAVAALLVGGASVYRATNTQAIIGVLLFHALFALSPMAGTALFAEAQVGEFFRVFIAYGVIFVSLAMNTAIQLKKKANPIRLSAPARKQGGVHQ